MARKLAIGDTVECRYYNMPERRSYGRYWQGEIVDINHSHTVGKHVRPYKVRIPDYGYMWLSRREIKRRIMKG